MFVLQTNIAFSLQYLVNPQVYLNKGIALLCGQVLILFGFGIADILDSEEFNPPLRESADSFDHSTVSDSPAHPSVEESMDEAMEGLKVFLPSPSL